MKHPYGGNSSQSSNQSFSSGRGKSNNRGFRGRFRPNSRGQGCGNPFPQWLFTDLPQFTSRSSPPFFQKRLASKQMFRQHVKHCHQWLRSSIHLKTKVSQSSPDSIRLQGPSKGTSSGLLYPVSSVKECNRTGGKCKISRVLQSLFLVPKPHQRWRPVIDLSRLNSFLLVERFKMETPESIRASLIPGEWVSAIDLSDTYLHIPIHPNSRKCLRFCHKSQVFQFTSLPFGLATAPQVFTMIVKKIKPMALTWGIRLHQYLDDWLIKAQSQEEAQVNTQTVVDLTQSLGWIINQEKSELKPTQVFSFVGYKYHLDSAHVKPTQERWLKLQDLIL